MTKTIEGKHDSRTLFGRVFAGLQNRCLRRCLPMHVPCAIGWDVVANHVKVMAESTLESLLRPLNVKHGRSHLFLGNDLGITDTVRFNGMTEVLHEEAKGISGRDPQLPDRATPTFGKHPLSGIRRTLLTLYKRNVETGTAKDPFVGCLNVQRKCWKHALPVVHLNRDRKWLACKTMRRNSYAQFEKAKIQLRQQSRENQHRQQSRQNHI